LALMLSVVAGSFAGYLLDETNEERFLRQMADHGQQAANSIARSQLQLLSVERRVANTEGVAQAVEEVDPEGARRLVLPLAIDAQSDYVSVLQPNGVSLVTVRREQGAGANYATLRSEDYFLRWNEVQSVLGLDGMTPSGAKAIGLRQVAAGTPSVLALVVVAPLVDESNDQVGAVVVGEYLSDLASTTAGQAGANVSIYDLVEGRVTATTLDGLVPETSTVPLDLAADALFSVDGPPPLRSLFADGQPYRETLLGLTSNQSGQPLAIMGVSLLDQTGPSGIQALANDNRQTVTYLVVFSSVTILLVLLFGLLISNAVAKPLAAMTHVTNQAVDGNTGIRLDEDAMGELGVLATAINRMIASLNGGRSISEITTKEISKRILRLSLDGGSTSRESTARRRESAVLTAQFGVKTGPYVGGFRLGSGEFEDILGEMIRVLARHKGTLIGYEPYTFIAVFGDDPPLSTLPRAVNAAVQASSDLIEKIERVTRERQAAGSLPLVLKLAVSAGEIRYLEDRESPGGVPDPGSTPVEQVAEVMMALRGQNRSLFALHDSAFRYLPAAHSTFEFGPPRQLTSPRSGKAIVVHPVVYRRPAAAATGQ
jgi:HAMP domain-containing protein